MNVPEGFYVIYQPKHRIPGVFDLNERGMFKTRPFVTGKWAYRAIANADLDAKLEYLCLVGKNIKDQATGESYGFVVEKALIDLDEELNLRSDDLSMHVSDATILNEILEAYGQWRNSYVPVSDNNKIDKKELKNKILASISERKEIIRKELVRRNSTWINPAMPGLIQDFRYGLYENYGVSIYDEYERLGGKETENGLIQKIMLFYRIYETDPMDSMTKPNGCRWKDDDEIWECWSGFAGSESEAKRICTALETVFRPLQNECTIQ